MAQTVLGAAAKIPELKATFSITCAAQASAASIQVFVWLLICVFACTSGRTKAISGGVSMEHATLLPRSR